MFDHRRHTPPKELSAPRELIVCLPPLRSQVNAARIVRAAGCCGVQRMVVCGRSKIDPKIARDALYQIELVRPRTLAPVLLRLREQGYRLVGVEQASHSQNLHHFRFQQAKTALVFGHERLGMTDDELKLMDDVVEIPVYGMPHSYNVATAAAMVLYEFCKQHPR